MLKSGYMVPVAIDVNVPNAARMYDHYLGGTNNFPADREAAQNVLHAAPWVRGAALENRDFLRRAVTSLARAGIRQFVDVGSGLPTAGNVHEIAHRAAPDARIAYADNDPVVLGHNRALLSGTPNATTIRADLRCPDSIISHPGLGDLIDWGKPVALLLAAVLHFIPDQNDPAAIIAEFRAVMAPGSHIVITHLHDPGSTAPLQRVISIYENASLPLVARTYEQIRGYFTGSELLEPGLVPLSQWRPETRPGAAREIWGLGGVGRL